MFGFSFSLAWAAVRAFAANIPWQVWAGVAILAAFLMYGSHREKQGYSAAEAIWQDKAAKLEKQRLEALKAEEQAYKALAKRTDTNVAKEREVNRDRTERFIAAGGVRQACPGNRYTPDNSPGSGEGVHQAPVMDGTEALPTVAVTPDDVRICTANTLTAEALQGFVLGLEE